MADEGGQGNDGNGNEGNAGNESSSWVDALPQDVREWDEVKNSDKPEKFWDQMVNMRSRMGSSVRIPSADAGEEDRAEFYKKIQEKVPGLMVAPDFEKEDTLTDLYSRMGRPTEAKDYTIPEFKDSKDQPVKNLDTEFIKAFQEKAHAAGLSQKQFNDALSAVVMPNVLKQEDMASKALEDRKTLANEWGTATERNSKIVENFLSHTDAPEAIVNALKAGGVDSKTMLWFHKMATQSVKNGDFQEDDSHRGVMTPDEAAIKISEIRNNKKHPYNNKHDPSHAAAKKMVRELYLVKNPNNKPAPGTAFNVGG